MNKEFNDIIGTDLMKAPGANLCSRAKTWCSAWSVENRGQMLKYLAVYCARALGVLEKRSKCLKKWAIQNILRVRYK